jgi:excisionase family DNA binding protein
MGSSPALSGLTQKSGGVKLIHPSSRIEQHRTCVCVDELCGAAYHSGMSDEDEDSYITVEEAAQILGLSTRQTHRYGQSGTPRLRTRKAGRRLLYNNNDVLSLAKDLDVARTPPPPPPQKEPPPPSPLLPELGDRTDPLTIGELISLQEAANYAGLTRGTLHDYAKKGRLRAKKLGAQWVTTHAAVDEYLLSRQRESST